MLTAWHHKSKKEKQYINWEYWDTLPPGTNFDPRVLAHCFLKNQTRKIDKIHKDF